MSEVLAREGGGGQGWLGKVFGMEEEEGKALLGTPNAVGTVWVLVNRVAVLGKRRMKVRVWNAGGGGLCMLWYLDDL